MHGDAGHSFRCVLCHLSGWKREGQQGDNFLITHTKASTFFLF